jgi:hypothetical protein
LRKGKLDTRGFQIPGGIVTDIYNFDYDGDGDADFLFTFLDYKNKSVKSSRPILVENDKGFSFFIKPIIPESTNTIHPRHAAFGDINKDGILDILIADHGGDFPPFDGGMPILLVSKNGRYLNQSNLLQPLLKGFYFSAIIADFNNDEYLDLFLGHIKSLNPKNHFHLFLWNKQANKFIGDDKRLPREISNVGNDFLSSVAIDSQKNGNNDIFFGGAEKFDKIKAHPKDSLLINKGDGRFENSSKVLPDRFRVDWGSASAQTADINGDSYMDIVTSTYPQHFKQGAVQFYINDKGGGFTSPSFPFNSEKIPFPFFIPWVSLGDFSGDSKQDVLFTLRMSTQTPVNNERFFRYYEQDVSGHFVDRTQDISIPNIPLVAAFFSDIDKDGRSELIFWDYQLNYYIIKNEK